MDFLINIYSKAKELIANQDKKAIDALFEQIKKIPEEKIKETKIKEVVPEDSIIKNGKDLNDTNFDPLISDDEYNYRENIKSSKQFIETIVRRSYYMCLKFNGRKIRGMLISYPANKLDFLQSLTLNIVLKIKIGSFTGFIAKVFMQLKENKQNML